MNVPIELATMSEHTWWWLARATGLVGWALATASIVWGLALSGRIVRRKRLPAWLLDLHRYLGTLTLAFVLVHMGALTLDRYVAFSLKDLFVPMASTWKPGPVTWGIAAFYVLVVIQLTSWGMKWLPRKVWHGIHLSSFFVFVTASIHGITAGTDASEPLVQMGALVGTTLLLTFVFLRVINSMNTDDAAGGARTAAAAARAARTAVPAADQGSPEPVVPAPVPVSDDRPAKRATGDVPLDPALAARLAKLGSRVGRTPRGSAPVGHAGGAEQQRGDALVADTGVDDLGHEDRVVTPADGVGHPALEPVGQVDEEGSAGLWAALEAEAVERVPLDGGRAEEGLPYIKLVFAEDTDGEGTAALDDGVGVAAGLDSHHHERWLERGL